MTTINLTLKLAKELLKTHNITIRRYGDEYRVNYRQGQEATAYYTTDLQDAVNTGYAMAKWLSKAPYLKPKQPQPTNQENAQL